MTAKRKHICVIGLGQFGGELARNLAKHCEVLAIDADEDRVNEISDEVQRALCLDASDANAISSVLSSDFDEVVISMGEHLEASIMATLHVRRMKIPLIWAKAETDDQAAVLKAVGANRIIFPERETAQRISAQIVNPNLLDFIPLTEDYRVMDVVAPRAFHRRSLGELDLRSRFDAFVMAVKKPSDLGFVFLPGPGYIIWPGDVLVMIGHEDSLVNIQDAKETQKETDEPAPDDK